MIGTSAMKELKLFTCSIVISKASFCVLFVIVTTSAVTIYLFKVNNRNIVTIHEIFSKETLKTPEERH